jgi:hypothetical protein
MDLSGDVLECPQCQDLIDCRREYGHGELSTGRSGSTDLPARTRIRIPDGGQQGGVEPLTPE